MLNPEIRSLLLLNLVSTSAEFKISERNTRKSFRDFLCGYRGSLIPTSIGSESPKFTKNRGISSRQKWRKIESVLFKLNQGGYKRQKTVRVLYHEFEFFFELHEEEWEHLSQKHSQPEAVICQWLAVTSCLVEILIAWHILRSRQLESTRTEAKKFLLATLFGSIIYHISPLANCACNADSLLHTGRFILFLHVHSGKQRSTWS